MTEGRRERKKQRTRDALVAAAVELFQTQGYEDTTVARIAEAADVSTRTFFLHFPAKEDVLLANAGARVDSGVRAIAERRPGEPVADVLRRAAERMITDTWQNDVPSGMASLRARLIGSEPALQAAFVHRMVTGQEELARALHEAFADEISLIDATALVGAVLGSVNAVALVSLRRGDGPDEVRAVMSRAVSVASGTWETAAKLGT